MMTLNGLLQRSESDLFQLDAQTRTQPFNQFRLDSRQVQTGDVLVVLASHSQDTAKSASYVASVIDKTAFVLSEIDPQALLQEAPELANHKAKLHFVPNIREYLGDLIQASLQHIKPTPLPSVVAITGTNGKTTISQLVAQLLEQAGKPSAVMGTAGNGRIGGLKQASHTTGDALAVQTFMHAMGVAGIDILALEASSHGLHQHRLQGVPIKVAVYTNLSRDHMDYHTDMDDYAHAKARLFDRAYFPTLTHAIINLDDDYATTMLEMASHSKLEVWTYSLHSDAQATFRAGQINPSLTGVEIELISNFGTIWVNSPLLGRFNVANLLASVASSVALGISLEQLPHFVQNLHGASGRMERVKSKQGCFIVDYAHTPDALTQVLTTLKSHCEGDLWAVFGCGGNRDRGKRPLMARAGLDVADKVVFTSDNPRFEDPEEILVDMTAEVSKSEQAKTIVIADRRQAIEHAVTHAKSNDIVVIAGKGHETYQDVNGVKHDFDDRVVLREALSKLNSSEELESKALQQICFNQIELLEFVNTEFGQTSAKKLQNIHQGGKNNSKGNQYEINFLLYQTFALLKQHRVKQVQGMKQQLLGTQVMGFVDDICHIDASKNSKTNYQLKNSSGQSANWTKETTDRFKKQHITDIQHFNFSHSKNILVVSDKQKQQDNIQKIPQDLIDADCQYFINAKNPYELTHDTDLKQLIDEQISGTSLSDIDYAVRLMLGVLHTQFSQTNESASPFCSVYDLFVQAESEAYPNPFIGFKESASDELHQLPDWVTEILIAYSKHCHYHIHYKKLVIDINGLKITTPLAQLNHFNNTDAIQRITDLPSLLQVLMDLNAKTLSTDLVKAD